MSSSKSRQRAFTSGGCVALVLGTALVVMGAILPQLVGDQIETAVESGLELEVDNDWLDVDPKIFNMHFFNVTNAYDVQMSGATPLLQEVVVDMTQNEIRYDAVLRDGGNAVEFWSYWDYVPTTAEDQVNFELSNIVQPNLVYIGGLVGEMGVAESTFFGGLASTVVGEVLSLFTVEGGGVFPAARVLAAGSFLGGTVQNCVDAQTALSGAYLPLLTSQAHYVAQWADLSSYPFGLANETLSESDPTVLGATSALAGPLSTFEVGIVVPGASIDTAVAAYLWNTTSTYSIVTTAGLTNWAAYLAALAAAPTLTASQLAAAAGLTTMVSDIEAVAGSTAAAETAISTTALYLATLTAATNDAYRATIAAAFGLGPTTTWAQMGTYHWGTGAITTLLTGTNSIVDLGLDSRIVTGPEWPRFIASHASTAAVGSLALDVNFTMGLDQSTAFLSTFSNTNVTAIADTLLYTSLTSVLGGNCTLIAGLLTTLTPPAIDPAQQVIFGAGLLANPSAQSCAQAALDAMGAAAPFTGTGLSAASAPAYAEYLATFLPRDFFVRGFVIGNIYNASDPTRWDLLPDGTGTLNSGLFARHSPKEIMFGYVDPLITLIQMFENFRDLVSSEHFGFFGEEYIYDTAEEQRVAYSGPASTWIDVRPRFYKIKTGKDDFQNRDVFLRWRNISDFTLREDVKSSPVGTKVWNTTETIAGSAQPSKFPALRIELCPGLRDGDCDQDPLPTFNIFVSQMMRTIEMKYIGTEIVKGIFTYVYTYQDSVFMLNDRNRDNYFMDQNFGIDMSPIVNNVPFVNTLPFHGKMDESERSKFSYTNGQGDFVPLIHDVQVFVDPVSGYAVRGWRRFQVNLRLKQSDFDSGIWSGMFATETDFTWPMYWADDSAEINDEDADDYESAIYGNLELAETLQTVFLVFGPVFLISAAALFFFARSAGASSSVKPVVNVTTKTANVAMRS